MTCWNKKELEDMLQDVVNELDLSADMCHVHGQWGTAPAELVRLILDQKDKEIHALKHGLAVIHSDCQIF